MKTLMQVASITTLFLTSIMVPKAQEYTGSINDFPTEQEEVKQTMEDIFQCVKDGDVDKLIAFHSYGPKFTEFKQGAPRNGAKANEEFERGVFGSVTETLKMDANDMKIAVYHGNVANVTFHSDFHLKFGDELVVVNDQITLLFVKNLHGEWKIVHEHHSPLKSKKD